jgi:site-specific recombinase XerD
MPNKPNLTSHNFRIGFITKLWRDTGDIKFVKQAIGHAKINTTSLYVENLSDEERQKRMQNVSIPQDLIIICNKNNINIRKACFLHVCSNKQKPYIPLKVG